MDHRDRARLAIAHRILELVRDKSFRDETVAAQDGDHVILPALPDDTMAYLFEQLRATDRPLHVAVPDGDDLAIIVMVPHAPAKHAAPRIDRDDECLISPQTQVGTVLDYLKVRGRPILCHEESPEVSVQLVG